MKTKRSKKVQKMSRIWDTQQGDTQVQKKSQIKQEKHQRQVKVAELKLS